MLGFGQLGLLAIGQLPTSAIPKANTFSSSSWSANPVKRGISVAVIATTFVGFVPPQTPSVSIPFTKFSQPSKIRANQESWRNAPIFQVSRQPVFSKFSTPFNSRVNLPDEQPSALFEIKPPIFQSAIFSIFSQPQFARINPPDEQTGTFFEIQLPAQAPFTGFARFSDVILAKSTVFLNPEFIQFNFTPAIPDTHDGGWIKKRKKRQDPLELKIQEERNRRAALELAVYGPEVEYKIEIPRFEEPKKPIEVGDLPQIIASMQHKNYTDEIARSQDDDENELAMILRDIV